MPLHTVNFTDWKFSAETEEKLQAIQALENGKIIFFPKLNFELSSQEQTLLNPALVDKNTKNVSFNLLNHEIRGTTANSQEKLLLQNCMQRFAENSIRLIKQLLPYYENHLQIGRTSFRPVEIKGRISPSYKKDDTRLHVDAFPANPNQGRRILRVFSNVNPQDQTRHWRVGQNFESVAKQFLPGVPMQIPASATLLKLLKITKSKRTAYDHIMLNIHDRMKKDMSYQTSVSALDVHFPPQTTWMVYTDSVSHAALAGQHVFEQTFYLPTEAMFDPKQSPLKILERLTDKELA